MLTFIPVLLAMPRPKVQIDDTLKKVICARHDEGMEHKEILRHLTSRYHFTISLSVLDKHLKAWGKTRYKVLPSKDETYMQNLRTVIMNLFVNLNATDNMILVDLRSRGCHIEKWKLRELRLEMGLTRRGDTDAGLRDEEILRVVREQLDKGLINDFGIRTMHANLRSNNLYISRDKTMRALRIVDPEGVKRRHEAKHRRRKKYFIEGPNKIWSVDAHCKLEIVGIQIYAVIDAFSRKILWIYVGPSARTAVSVVAQFLRYFKDRKVMPERVRSDRGVETILAADAFHKLCLAQPDRYPEWRAIEWCWMFGKSTANQRIEAWWNQLQTSMLQRWVVFFDRLKQEGHFKLDQMADRIAIYAIYMRLIRDACFLYVEEWNRHRIRSQKERTNVTAGVPWFLYEHPKVYGAHDYSAVPDPDLVESFSQEVEAYDLDEYLPVDTLQWCRETMSTLGYDLDTLTAGELLDDGSGRRVHGQAFIQLKERIQQHLHAGNHDPILAESDIPIGAGAWKPSAAAVQALAESRRNEEPEEFRAQMGDLLVDEVTPESDDENYESAGSPSVDMEEG